MSAMNECVIDKNALWSVFLNFCFNVKRDVCNHLYKIMMLKSFFVVHVTRFVMSEVYDRMYGENHV